MKLILAINPGSTSTKIALYQDETPLWTESIDYGREALEPFHHVIEQCDMRRQDIESVLKKHDVPVASLDAVVGRGGPFKPLEGGTYRVNETLLEDIRQSKVQAEHISNIGAVLAQALADEAQAPAFFVDPVSVDEFEPLARYSGLPELPRQSLVHALNIKATARKAAQQLGRSLADLNLIVAHLGGGISISPVKGGRIIDANNANDGGPFSPERAGSVPVTGLLRLCFSGRYTEKELKKKLVGQGGVVAYLGVNDGREVNRRIDAGDAEALAVFQALAYQIAKEIGAMCTVLNGQVDAIVLTGGMAQNERLMDWVSGRIAFLAPILRFPGENELEALALGALRVLREQEEPKIYR